MGGPGSAVASAARWVAAHIYILDRTVCIDSMPRAIFLVVQTGGKRKGDDATLLDTALLC